VVVGVVPYVPTCELALLQRDTFTFEARQAYDGGDDGLDLIRRAAVESRVYLRPGAALLLEIGGAQADTVGGVLGRLGYTVIDVLADPDGDVRGIEATLAAATSGGTAETDPATHPERFSWSM
jgi:release factor glutamine methyltransferase